MLLLNRSQSNLQNSSRRWQQYTVWFSITSTVCITAAWILKDAIAPVAVQAVPLRGNVMLDVQAGETYDAFMQRATAAAKAATQGTFNRNSSISDLSIVVTGQNRGATVQVLTLRASRNQWRSNPNAGRWATYYPTAQSLLGLATPIPVATTTVNAQSGNTQQPGTVQQPGVAQPLVPGQPVIVLPFVPGQPVQVRPIPNGTNFSPTPTVSNPGGIIPNTPVTTTQQGTT
ncbi:MAG: hypothetical protein DCF22_09050 [Leptolyngbya sp.]|nr:MAG: hypothetical protein DCF22_09050 [Leptolyngbya sp.]